MLLIWLRANSYTTAVSDMDDWIEIEESEAPLVEPAEHAPTSVHGERQLAVAPNTRVPTCCLQDNFFNFFRMASTTLRLVDYDFQRFQDRFDYSSDY